MPPTTERNPRFFYLHIQEIGKVVYKTTLLDICCQAYAVKNACIYTKHTLNARWAYRIASRFTGILHNSFLADVPDLVGVKKYQDFIRSLVAFSCSNICDFQVSSCLPCCSNLIMFRHTTKLWHSWIKLGFQHDGSPYLLCNPLRPCSLAMR